MRAFILCVIALGLLTGCGKKPPRDFMPDPQGWFIESYDNGVITVQHEGNRYMATCDSSRSFNNAGSLTDKSNVVDFPTCDLAIELVGQNVQAFEGKEKDAAGRMINMWSVGSTLALRSWRDEHTPWRQEEFKITSVTKKLQ